MVKSLFSFHSSQTLSFEELEKLRGNSGFLLYHGGLDVTQAGETTINLDKLGSQQNKRNKTYGGFYLTDGSAVVGFGEGEKIDWAEQYARQRNGNLHAFLISSDAKVLDCRSQLSDEDAAILENTRNLDRLSNEQRKALSEKYDLIVGCDLLRRTQYVLLNAEVITAVGFKFCKLQQNAEETKAEPSATFSPSDGSVTKATGQNMPTLG